MDVRTALVGLKKDLYEFCDETKFLTQTVNDFANKFESQSYNSGKSSQTKTKKVGKVVAVSGGVVCVAGIGLSLISLGAAVGVILAGGLLIGAGGATNSVTGKNHNTARVSQIRQDVLIDAIEKYNSLLNRIKEKSLQIGRELESFCDIDTHCSHWCEFWSGFWNGILHRGQTSNGQMRWSETVKSIQTTHRSKKDSPRNGGVEVRVDITGIDVDLFIDTLEDSRRKRVYKILRSVKELARSLEDSCPSKNEINNMVEDTLAEVH